jgi:hypothetical protein
MDPYLEGPEYWPGLHLSLIVAMRAAINRHLPANYFAEVDQYVWLETEEEDPERRAVRPDAYAVDSGGKDRAAGGGAVALTTPSVRVTLPAPKKKRGKRFVRIVDREKRGVVTVIELLSPSDKGAGRDRANYLLKRDQYLAAGVNLVEIDLLRSGNRSSLGDPEPPDGDYYAFVCRADDFPKADVWSFTVRDSFPVIPVPLKADDSSVPLDLRGPLDQVYEDARYGDRIDYAAPPIPALRPADAAWAADLLKKTLKKKKK